MKLISLIGVSVLLSLSAQAQESAKGDKQTTTTTQQAAEAAKRQNESGTTNKNARSQLDNVMRDLDRQGRPEESKAGGGGDNAGGRADTGGGDRVGGKADSGSSDKPEPPSADRQTVDCPKC